MDSKEIDASLRQYGFSENEVLIYIYLLKKIEVTAFEIAKNTKIPRTTVYTTLEKLKDAGFISQSKKNNVAYFTPESPKRLLTALKEKEDAIKNIMPQIQAITYRNFDAPVTKLFIGLDGVKQGLADILETLENKKIDRVYATSQPDLLEYLPKYFPSWLKAREDLGVFTELILPSHATNYLKSNKLREVRFLPEKFPFYVSFTIYGDKIVFFSFTEGDPYSVIIESKSISSMFKQFFLFAWEMTEKSENND